MQSRGRARGAIAIDPGLHVIPRPRSFTLAVAPRYLFNIVFSKISSRNTGIHDGQMGGAKNNETTPFFEI